MRFPLVTASYVAAPDAEILTVIPAEAGIQAFQSRWTLDFLTPAFAGVTTSPDGTLHKSTVLPLKAHRLKLPRSQGDSPDTKKGSLRHLIQNRSSSSSPPEGISPYFWRCCWTSSLSRFENILSSVSSELSQPQVKFVGSVPVRVFAVQPPARGVRKNVLANTIK